jgi:hypothetical protein
LLEGKLMDDAQPTPKRSWRPQLSLLSALLLMTIVGLAIVVVQLWREVDPLRTEVRQLREQVGVLTINDPSVVHVVGVPTDADGVMKWRIYVPAHKTVMLRARCGDVTRTAYPESKFQHNLGSGEQLLTITAKRQGNRGISLVANIHAPQGDSMVTMAFTEVDLTGVFETYRVSSSTEVMDKNDKLALVRSRFAPPGNSQLLGKDVPLPGYIIWLERQ